MESEKEIPESDPGDEGEVLPIEGLLEDGSLSTQRPSARAGGAGAQPAFVDEDDGTAFPAGFFLMAGHL